MKTPSRNCVIKNLPQPPDDIGTRAPFEDCIGSAFNAKGAMQCPNCRQVEQGQWLYASSCFRQPHLAGIGSVEDDLENRAGMHSNLISLRDGRFVDTPRRPSHDSPPHFPVSYGDNDYPLNNYARQHQMALLLGPTSGRMNVQNIGTVTRASHEMGVWSTRTVEAARSLRWDADLPHLSELYLPRAHEWAHHGGNILLGPLNTDEGRTYGRRYPLTVAAGLTNGSRHSSNRWTRERAMSFIPPTNPPLESQNSQVQELGRGLNDQAGIRARLEAYPSQGSTAASGQWWGRMMSSVHFNPYISSQVAAIDHTGTVPSYSSLNRASDSQGHAERWMDSRNQWA